MHDTRRYNLVLPYGARVPRGDVEYLRDLIHDRAPHVRVIITHGRPRLGSWLRSLTRPTCVVSFHPVTKRRFARGRVLDGQPLGKAEQCGRLLDAGLPVPPFVVLTPDGDLPDVSDLGAYVVTKPDFGGQGFDVRIVRSEDVRYVPPRSERARRYAARSGNANLFVQRFIYTGQRPVTYRVSTLFGRTICAIREEASSDRASRRDAADYAAAGDGAAASSGSGCSYELCDDRDVIDLSERAHAVFPDIPMLGVNVLRDETTGQLYLLEINPMGYTWPLDRRVGLALPGHQHLDVVSTFDSYNTAADALIEAATTHAR